MTQISGDYSPVTEVSNESELADDFAGFATQGDKLKPTTNFMREIEIMRENKILKSSLEDFYDY